MSAQAQGQPQEIELPGEGVDIKAFARRFGNFTEYAYYYIRTKLWMDPLYPAVFSELRGRDLPLLDLGCGMGVLAFYLRERGYRPPILGIDYDPRKIRSARGVAVDYAKVEFQEGDARRSPLEFAGDVTILDILQFFTEADQRAILEGAAAAARRADGRGKVVIRSTVQDESMRFRVSRTGDQFAKLTFWMKDHPTEYPTLHSLEAPFLEAGFKSMIRPCWGKTRFNNYLLVFTQE